MKLATFVTPDGAQRVGVVEGDRIREVSGVTDMLSLIEVGVQQVKTGKEAHDLKRVKLLAPIPRPPRLRDFLCFELHVRQSRANRYLFGMGTERVDPAKVEIAKVWYERPVYYKGNTFSVVGQDAEVHWPSYSRIIDYELEIGLVIGRGGKNV
jgi:2-keto-4-pentenoate hydratase/2-oxohepta-3-ene-1,7-dioic acid hydratase in catechol pathway